MADVPQLEDPRGEDLKSDAKLIGINFRALRDDLQANSTFAVQELVNATATVNLTNSDVQVELVSCTLPTGWKSMDVILFGKCNIVSTTGTDHRVDVWLESPSTTLLNVKATVSIITTGTFARIVRVTAAALGPVGFGTLPVELITQVMPMPGTMRSRPQ